MKAGDLSKPKQHSSVISSAQGVAYSKVDTQIFSSVIITLILSVRCYFPIQSRTYTVLHVFSVFFTLCTLYIAVRCLVKSITTTKDENQVYEAFRRAVFNVKIGNQDDHGKCSMK